MKRYSLNEYLDGLKQQNTVILAQAITLVESKKASDQAMADQLLHEILNIRTSSIRIGITGTPGVGKSSFIEGFGGYLIDHHDKRVAVLAVDPSSQRTGGSILGDKTRMNTLSKRPEAYIRPSAAGAVLGGVNNRTRESILLCEAAGFDVVMVETVGVGQSETLVNQMVDFFLLMIQPGSGDDLQGIKKGIMEMAHGIVINKADGDQAKLAKQSKIDLLHALHLFAANDSGWAADVMLCSALQKEGFDDVWQMIRSYHEHMETNGRWDQYRRDQRLYWFKDRVDDGILQRLRSHPELCSLEKDLTDTIQQNELSVSEATRIMLETVGRWLP